MAIPSDRLVCGYVQGPDHQASQVGWAVLVELADANRRRLVQGPNPQACQVDRAVLVEVADANRRRLV